MTTAHAMRCYAPGGTEYPAERWEECHAKWQEGDWYVDTGVMRSDTVLCIVGYVGGKHASANRETIRAAFCAATTAYHKAHQ
jgi:hypothetical protein